MLGFIHRFGAGNRPWVGECLLRLGGVGFLLASWWDLRWLARLQHALPPHETIPIEWAAAAAACAALSAGIALSIEGPGLFRQQPCPPRCPFHERQR